MTDIWGIRDTVSLIGVVENIKPSASYLADTYFPNALPTVNTDYIAVEYMSKGRVLAPYISKGSRGVNINRATSRVRSYKPPTVGVRRVIGPEDIRLRAFGEQPIFSTTKPEERLARMQAEDMRDLLDMIANRRNKMAADILQTGKTEIKAYNDDGAVIEQDLIDFDWQGLITPTVTWDNANATIYSDLMNASEKIQEESGYIPTLMLCGKNVEQYLLANTEIKNWLQIPSRENLNMASFSPRYTTPQSRFVGYISALNLEIVSYNETYTDDDGQVKPFLNPDTVIIGNPGRGRHLTGSILLMENGNFHTYAAPYVPHYVADDNSQTISLSLYSRFLLVPNVIEDFVCLKVK